MYICIGMSIPTNFKLVIINADVVEMIKEIIYYMVNYTFIKYLN